MKRIRLQDVFYLNGKLVECVGTSDTRVVYLNAIDPEECPHCKGLLPPKQHAFVEHAPILQEHIRPVQTIEQ